MTVHNPGKGGAVLVVDDVAATRQGLAELLRLQGYQTLEAANGSDALKMLQDHPHVAVAIVDLMMPTSNGYWFREQQLRDPNVAHVPVVVFTAADVTASDAGLSAVEVLRKPVAVDAVLAAVRRYCGE